MASPREDNYIGNLVKFLISEIGFIGNAFVSELPTNARLLEDSNFRLLEDSSYRLLE